MMSSRRCLLRAGTGGAGDPCAPVTTVTPGYWNRPEKQGVRAVIPLVSSGAYWAITTSHSVTEDQAVSVLLADVFAGGLNVNSYGGPYYWKDPAGVLMGHIDKARLDGEGVSAFAVTQPLFALSGTDLSNEIVEDAGFSQAALGGVDQIDYSRSSSQSGPPDRSYFCFAFRKSTPFTSQDVVSLSLGQNPPGSTFAGGVDWRTGSGAEVITGAEPTYSSPPNITQSVVGTASPCDGHLLFDGSAFIDIALSSPIPAFDDMVLIADIEWSNSVSGLMTGFAASGQANADRTCRVFYHSNYDDWFMHKYTPADSSVRANAGYEGGSRTVLALKGGANNAAWQNGAALTLDTGMTAGATPETALVRLGAMFDNSNYILNGKIYRLSWYNAATLSDVEYMGVTNLDPYAFPDGAVFSIDVSAATSASDPVTELVSGDTLTLPAGVTLVPRST